APRSALSPDRRRALEAGGDRREGDFRPALGIHELLPAAVEVPLVALRDVPLGHHARIVGMRPSAAEPHGQILWVPAPETAAARLGHLPPVVDVVLLEQARRPVVRLAADADRALDLLG